METGVRYKLTSFSDPHQLAWQRPGKDKQKTERKKKKKKKDKDKIKGKETKETN